MPVSKTFCPVVRGGVALALLCSFALVLPAQAKNPLPSMLETQPVAQQFPWADDVSGRPIRALFLIPPAAILEPYQLKSTFDLKMDLILHAPAGQVKEISPPEKHSTVHYIYSDDLSAVRKQFKKRYDVILMGNIAPESLEKALVEEILNQLRKGAGLITAWMTFPTGHPLRGFLDKAKLEVSAGEAILQGAGALGLSGEAPLVAAANGNTRVVQFTFSGMPPQAQALFPVALEPSYALPGYHQNVLALLTRTIRWAAHREPDDGIIELTHKIPQKLNDVDIPPQILPEYVEAVKNPVMDQGLKPIQIQFARPTRKPYDFTVQIRRPDDRTPLRISGQKPIPKGSLVYDFPLLLGPGTHWLDVVLFDKKKTRDWYCQALTIPGWPVLQEVELSKEYLLPNDLIEISVHVPELIQPVHGPQRMCTLYARAVDALPNAAGNENRLLSEAFSTLSHEGGKAILPLRVADLISPLVRIDIYAFDGPPQGVDLLHLHGQQRETRYISVRLPFTKGQPAQVIEASHLHEYTMQSLINSVSHFGVNAITTPEYQNGLFLLPAAQCAYWPEITPPSPALLELSKQDKHALTDIVALHYAGAPPMYCLGDQAFLQDLYKQAGREMNQADFVRWLQEQYQDLFSLNNRWGVDFQDWSQAGMAIAEPTSLPMSITCEQYKAKRVSEYISQIRTVMRSVDSAVQIGAVLPFGQSRELDFLSRRVEAVLDWSVTPVEFVSPEKHLSNKMKAVQLSTDFPGDDSWQAEAACFYQYDTLWYKDFFAPGQLVSRLQNPMNGTVGRAVSESIHQLLMTIEPIPAQVAIYQCPEAVLLEKAFPGLCQQRRDLADSLFALGYTVDTLTRETLPHLTAEATPVLFLPGGVFLSEHDLEHIKQYLVDGGHIISDGSPGTCYESGQERTTGVPLNTNDFPQKIKIMALPVPSNESAREAWCRKLQTLVSESGVAPAVSLEKPTNGFQHLAYRFGKASLTAWLMDETANQPVSLHLTPPPESFVYELIQGDAVKKKRNIVLKPGQKRLYTQLPYQVTDILVSTPAHARPGTRLPVALALQTQPVLPGKHLMQITLAPLQGKAQRHYTRYLLCKKGIGETYIPLARNEKPGKYEVRVTDLLTGTMRKTVVEVH